MNKRLLFSLFTLLFFNSIQSQNVGIGTVSPVYGKLEISSSNYSNQLVARNNATTGTGISFFNVANYPMLGFNSMYNNGYSVMGAGYGSFFSYNPSSGTLDYYTSPASVNANTVFSSGVTTSLTIAANGNVGIGAFNPAYRMDINGRMRLRYTGSTYPGIWFNRSNDTEGTLLAMVNDNTLGLYGPDNSGSAGWKFGFDLTNAWMGIGTANPKAGLHLFNRDIYQDNSLGKKSVVITPNGNGGFGGEIRLFTNGSSTDSTLVLRGSYASNKGSEILMIDPVSHNRKLEISSDYQSTGRSRVIVDELQIKGGADFAEFFDVKNQGSVKPEPGMLVSIDGEEPGKLTVTNIPYDKKVAGVISGANGIKPGMTMEQSGSVAGGRFPVSLSGRVYVHCSAERAPIHAGDLLTSASVPGYAMKAVNKKRSGGAIIGKAMSNLESGTGWVLVLLGLQ